MKYQIFDDLEGDAYQSLKDSITENGVLCAVEYDENGEVLDGHQRIRICEELGITSWPRMIRKGLTEDQKLQHAYTVNAERRQLTREQRKRAWQKMREAGMTLQAIAEADGTVSRFTVQRSLDSTCANEQVPSSTIGKDGKARPTHYKPRTVYVPQETVEKVERLPEQVKQAVLSGDVSVSKANRIVKKEQYALALCKAQESIDIAKRNSIESVCDIRVCSCSDLFRSGIKPDAVITDPPYPKEFLHVFTELAEGCKLTGVALVAVMSGQSYLPEVMARLCEHMRYRWTLAYLTPGGQAVQQWQAKVNTAWKPVLLFGDSMEWFGDVAASKPNDNDKRFHGWGQSESGIADLIERLTKPGQLVCDPFLGGGTTAVVSLALGRRFVGCDIDLAYVETAKARVMA